MSPDTAIDILPEAALLELQKQWYEVSPHDDRPVSVLRRTVREGYEAGFISRGSILAAAEEYAESPRLVAAHQIIAEQNRALAKAHTIISVICANARMQPDASMNGSTDIYAVPLDDIETASQWLVGAMLRDRREGVR
jgi:hypothetical protein